MLSGNTGLLCEVSAEVVKLPVFVLLRLNGFPIPHADRSLSAKFPVKKLVLFLFPSGDSLTQKLRHD